mgnify:CR=1 FL=1
MSKEVAKERIILGIDPGTNILGYGLIKEVKSNMELLTMGVIRLDDLTDHPLKLQRIFERTLAIIDEYHPDCLAIEAPFYGKNAQSMLKLGRAQGVAIAAAMTSGVSIQEYAPRKIKQSITGNGNASKEQVAAMLSSIYGEFTSKYLDATDALAVATCHFYQNSNLSTDGKSYSGWDSFLKNNPSRIR